MIFIVLFIITHPTLLCKRFCINSETKELPFPTAGAVAFPGQAQFHPLKFLSQIAQNLNIYENTFVKEFSENTAITESGRISFKKIIFATHFPIDNKHGMYFLKMYQQRSYCIALENAAKMNGMYVDASGNGMQLSTVVVLRTGIF